MSEEMEKVYRQMDEGDIPWNIPEPPILLQTLMSSGVIAPCRMIEVGCGLGHHARYFARLGFEVTGVDIAPSALRSAAQNTVRGRLACRYVAADMRRPAPFADSCFGFAYDWEVLHHIHPSERLHYVENLYRILKPSSHYVSLCFHESDTHFGGKGKFRKTPLGTTLYFSSVDEMKNLFDPYFQIDDLRVVTVPGRSSPHEAVYVRMTRK